MDAIDFKILTALETNAREKNSVLARRLNIPPSTLKERIRRLEHRGVIRGYRAMIAPEALGIGVQAFIAVSLEHHESRGIRRFETGIQKITHIRACYHLSGRFDYLLHVVARDLGHLGDLVKTEITALPDFGKCETFIIFSETEPEPTAHVEL